MSRRNTARSGQPGPVNGEVAFWWNQLGPRRPRPALDADRAVDVAIIGAGYTGLWTAYALATADPGLRIAILEQEFAGFGASGRNGGWLSGEFAWPRGRSPIGGDPDPDLPMQHALWAAVDEVLRVADTEGIDADIRRSGALRVATSPAQLARLEQEHADASMMGIGPDDCVVLTAEQLALRVRIAGALGGDWSPHAARVQPARLVHGLALAVERRGVTIFEDTRVVAIEPHRVRTTRGTVSAPIVLRTTEGFTAQLPGLRREVLPMNSALIATARLSDRQWDAIGWSGEELLGDMAHAYFYAQRTADGRIALGGRGVPYRFGSRTDDRGHTPKRTIDLLQRRLLDMFPMLAGIGIDHAWCGVLGVPRDWCPTVGLDRRTGIGWAGGYVGVGVATSNLAGRTLAALVRDEHDPLLDLPWVNRPVRRWEPEPLRWTGVRGLYSIYRWADRRETRSGRTATSRLATWANKVSGRAG